MALRISGTGGNAIGTYGKKRRVGRPDSAMSAKKALNQGRIPSKPPALARKAQTNSPKQQGRSSSGTGTGTGRSYSSGTNYSSGVMSSPSSLEVTNPVPSEEDYLKGDATYQATLSALAKQLQSFQTDINSQRANRKLDYDKAIKDLGYIAPTAPGGEATWNWDDTLTASGRAYQNLVNDAASRGTLQSSGYADSLNDLTRSLMDQYTGINDSNTQFNTDLDRQLTKAKDENTAASQAARAEAIMRRAAQYGFGV